MPFIEHLLRARYCVGIFHKLSHLIPPTPTHCAVSIFMLWFCSIDSVSLHTPPLPPLYQKLLCKASRDPSTRHWGRVCGVFSNTPLHLAWGSYNLGEGRVSNMHSHRPDKVCRKHVRHPIAMILEKRSYISSMLTVLFRSASSRTLYTGANLTTLCVSVYHEGWQSQTCLHPCDLHRPYKHTAESRDESVSFNIVIEHLPTL